MADIFAGHLLQHIPFIASEFKAIAFQVGFEFKCSSFSSWTGFEYRTFESTTWMLRSVLHCRSLAWPLVMNWSLYCVQLAEAKVSVGSNLEISVSHNAQRSSLKGFLFQSDKIGWSTSTSHNLFAKSLFNHQSVKASAADLRLLNGCILSLFSHASTLTYLKSVIFHLFLCGPFYYF